MATNRLLPYQFAKGLSAAPTRIETALRKLVATFNDVPPDLIARRWTPTHRVARSTGTPLQVSNLLPWMTASNVQACTGRQPGDADAVLNDQRAKSTGVPGIVILRNSTAGELYTWEVTFKTTRPTMLSSATLFAEYNAYYLNQWKNGAAPAPPTKTPNDPANDFTFQICVDDAWDATNRRKLRQEALVYQTSAQTYENSPNGVAAWVLSPQPVIPETLSSPTFKAVTMDPLVLLPELATVRVQVTFPVYSGYNSTWNTYGPGGNTWTVHLELWECTQ